MCSTLPLPQVTLLLGLLLVVTVVLLWSGHMAETTSWLWSSVIISTLALRSPIGRFSMFGTCWSSIEMASGNPVTKVSLVCLSGPTLLNIANPANFLILFALTTWTCCQWMLPSTGSLSDVYPFGLFIHLHVVGHCIPLQIQWQQADHIIHQLKSHHKPHHF